MRSGPIDWLSVTSASYRFAYAKATEGTTISDVTYPLNRAAKLVVAPVARKIDTHHHFSDRIDGFENVAQANKIA